MAHTTANFVVIGLLLAISWITVFAWDLEHEISEDNLDGETLRFKRQTTPDNKKCNHELLKNLKATCCKFPGFFGNGTWRDCKKSVLGTAENDSKATPEQRFCVAQCVFKNKNLLGSDGNTVDSGKLSTALLANKNATWTPILQTAISSCIASVGNVAPLPTKSGGKTCNPTPASLMWCIRRQIILSCPVGAKLNGANCAADLQTLSSCLTPPALRNSNVTASG